MSNIWLTSDTHFNHNKDFIYKERGFNSVEEMNQKIVENWNTLIQDDDIVYHLGDVYMGADHDAAINIISSLKGRKFLAYGNHDSDVKIQKMKENNIFEDIQMGYRIKKGKKHYILTHYPTIVENGDNTFAVSVHGHTHATEPFTKDSFGKEILTRVHIGLDTWDLKPVKLEDVLNIIKEHTS